VTEDLPRAVAAIRDGGSQVAMLTTGLTRPDDPAARATLQAARAVGVPRLKAGYYRYAFADVRRELAEATTKFRLQVQKERDALEAEVEALRKPLRAMLAAFDTLLAGGKLGKWFLGAIILLAGGIAAAIKLAEYWAAMGRAAP
jgi:hypothetical protein